MPEINKNSVAIKEKRNMTFEEFKDFFKEQISGLKIRLSETINKILSVSQNDFTEINVVDRGTCISYSAKEVKNGRYIDFIEKVTLNIGYEETMYMYQNCNDNLFEAFNKIVTHEFLHILFGDFDERKLKNCYNYSIGAIEQGKLKNDMYYAYNPDATFDRMGHKKIDARTYNYAADFVINRELGIEAPFLRAEDFGLDPELNVFQYYSILVNGGMPDLDITANGDTKSDDSSNGGNGSDDGESSDSENSDNNQGGGSRKVDLSDPKYQGKTVKEIIDEYTGYNPMTVNIEDLSGESNDMDRVPLVEKEMTTVSDEDLLDSMFLGKDRGFDPSSINFVIRSLKKKNSNIFKVTDEMINKIKSDMYNVQDTPVNKFASWQKYNNRKEDSDIIVPGKVYQEDPTSKDNDKKTIPVIFIDCSGSMTDILKELFYFTYNLVSRINCSLVFYDTKILKVISSSNSLNFDISMFMGGGTCIKNAIEEYKEKINNQINNVYAFTDGYDDFDDLGIEYFTAYEFSKSGVRELKEIGR